MLLDLQGLLVVLVAGDPGDHGEVVEALGEQPGVAGRHGIAYGGESGADRGDLRTHVLHVVREGVNAGDEAGGPRVESGGCLTVPVDPAYVCEQFVGGGKDRVPGVPEGFAHVLQMLWMREVHHVLHFVQLVLLETGTPLVDALRVRVMDRGLGQLPFQFVAIRLALVASHQYPVLAWF
ncbi:hypothetical protein [Streptomyces sp. NPDC001851]|uniref:hypothetical protein n=1 Tax=Streptomyces sp. NPDC001851 TaxID=3154529 RepID=UPI003332E83D